MKVYHKGYSLKDTKENNTRNSTHGVGFYVYKDLSTCKNHISSNNNIYSYDLESGNYLQEPNVPEDILNKLKNINVEFDVNSFNKTPFNTIIDKVAVSTKFKKLNTALARLETSKLLKSIGIDGIIFNQNGIAYCIFNKDKLKNEEQVLKEEYFQY